MAISVKNNNGRTYTEFFYQQFDKTMELLNSMYDKPEFQNIMPNYDIAKDIDKIPLPEFWNDKFLSELIDSEEKDLVGSNNEILYDTDAHERIHIEGIEDELFSVLNNTDVIKWREKKQNIVSRDLSIRSVTDFTAKYTVDNEGNYVFRDVVYNQSKDIKITYVLSTKAIRVKLGVVNQNGFGFIDSYVANEDDGFSYASEQEEKQVYYLYAVPQRYCYAVKQTALILSPIKGGSFKTFYGITLPFTTGSFLRLLVAEKPRRSSSVYKLITVRHDLDYRILMQQLIEFWVSKGLLFDKSEFPDLNLAEEMTFSGRKPYGDEEVKVTDYEAFDLDKPMEYTNEETITQ